MTTKQNTNKRQSFTHNARFAAWQHSVLNGARLNRELNDLLATIGGRGETVEAMVLDSIGGCRSMGHWHLDELIDHASNQTQPSQTVANNGGRRMAEGEIYECHFSKSAMEKAKKQCKLALLAIKQDNYNKYFKV